MTDKTVLEKWAGVVRTAWENEAFKAELLKNPAAVLKAAGMDPGVDQVFIHEDSASARHFVLPAKPSDVSVEDADKLLLGDANPGF